MGSELFDFGVFFTPVGNNVQLVYAPIANRCSWCLKVMCNDRLIIVEDSS